MEPGRGTNRPREDRWLVLLPYDQRKLLRGQGPAEVRRVFVSWLEKLSVGAAETIVQYLTPNDVRALCSTSRRIKQRCDKYNWIERIVNSTSIVYIDGNVSGTPISTTESFRNKEFVIYGIAKSLAANSYRVSIVTTDGALYNLGYVLVNLPNMDSNRTLSFVKVYDEGVQSIEMPNERRNFTSYIVNTKGELWTTLEPSMTIAQIFSDANVKQVSCSSTHCAFVTHDGDVYAWGDGSYGQLGDGVTDLDDFNHMVSTPQKMEYFSLNAIAVSCGNLFTVVLTRSGKAYSFGYGEFGVLGDGNSDFHAVSEPFLIPIEQPLVAVSCARDHTICISVDGSIYGFGTSHKNGVFGGDLSWYSMSTPQRIDFPFPVQKVRCSPDHTAVITHNGLLYLFGKDIFPSSTATELSQTIHFMEAPSPVVDVAFGQNFVAYTVAGVPFLAERAKVGACAACGEAAYNLCAACKGVHYCDSDCQKRHWRGEHSLKCNSAP